VRVGSTREGDFMFRSILCVAVIAMSLPATASISNEYYTVKSVELSEDGLVIQEIKLNQDAQIYGVNPLENAQGLPSIDGLLERSVEKVGNVGGVIATANQIIALGERIYKIIEKGRPVLHTSYAPISVIAKDKDGNAVDMFQTSGWSRPSTSTYSVKYRNGFNMTVVEFKFTLIFSYGGRYQGKGKYITAAQIVPSDVQVAWGFNVSATMSLDGIFNHGTVAEPVAGANLRLNYKIDTVVKTEERNMIFYIGGDGQVRMY
jgi:hypothetical protein